MFRILPPPSSLFSALFRGFAVVFGFLLSFSAFARADVSGPPPFLQGVSMYVEKWTAYSFVTNTKGLSPGHDGFFSSGGAARLALPFGTYLGGQMDFGWEFSDVALTGNGNTNDLFSDAFQMGHHLFLRDHTLGLLGAFGGFGVGYADRSRSGGSYWFSGAEAHGFLEDLTLTQQVGYFTDFAQNTPVVKNTVHDALFSRTVGRYFLPGDSNERVQAEVSFVYGEGGFRAPTQNTTLLEWGLRYDRVLKELPLVGTMPAFIGYRGTHSDLARPGGASDVEHAFYFGMNWSFGGADVKTLDRKGASLDLPNIGRWLALGSR